jgi:hypothetical protein
MIITSLTNDYIRFSTKLTHVLQKLRLNRIYKRKNHRYFILLTGLTLRKLAY